MQIVKANSGILESRSVWGSDGLSSSASVSSSGGTSTDSSIITLVAEDNIIQGRLVGINENGKAITVTASFPTSAIGISVNTALYGQEVQVKISGKANTDMSNCLSGLAYAGEDALLVDWWYLASRYTQFIGYKISENEIFLDIGKRILML